MDYYKPKVNCFSMFLSNYCFVFTIPCVISDDWVTRSSKDLENTKGILDSMFKKLLLT